jgi:hypothetical protein
MTCSAVSTEDNVFTQNDISLKLMFYPWKVELVPSCDRCFYTPATIHFYNLRWHNLRRLFDMIFCRISVYMPLSTGCIVDRLRVIPRSLVICFC